MRVRSYLKKILAAACIAALVGSVMPGVVSGGSQTWGAAAVQNPERFNTRVRDIRVASDSTIVAIIDSDADGVFDDLGVSNDRGVTFGVIVSNVIANGTAISDVEPSPTFVADRNLFVAGGTTVMRSVDGGSTWAANGSGATAFAVTDLAVAPTFSNGSGPVAVSFLAGGFGTPAVQTSVCAATPACGSWTNLNFQTAADAAGEGTYAVAYSPNYVSDGMLIAVAGSAGGAPCGAAGLCEIRSGGGGNFGTPVQVNSSALAGASVKFGFPEGFNQVNADNYLLATNTSVYRRLAGTWTDAVPSGAATPASSISVSGSFSSATIYVGGTNPSVAPALASVYRSTNGGVNWSAATIGGSAGGVSVAVSPSFSADNSVYASTTGMNGGLWVSVNGGVTAQGWTAKGLFADNYTEITGIYAAPTASGAPFFAIFKGAGAADDALFRSTSPQPTANTLWSKNGYLVATQGSNATDVTAAAVSANFSSDQVVYIGGGTQLARSTNGGTSFNVAFINPIPTGTVSSGFGIAVANASMVFVAATNGTIHRTTDGGVTWESVALPGSGFISDMLLSPNFATDNTLLVGVRNSAGGASAYLSRDAGAHFSQLGNHPDTSTVSGRHQVAFDTSYSGSHFIYSATDTDVYRWSVGNSDSWLALSAGANVAGGSPNDLPLGAADISNIGVVNGVLYASRTGGPGARGVRRTINPTAMFDGTTKSQWFDLGWVGLNGLGTSQSGSGVLDQGFVPGSTFSVLSRGMALVPLSSASTLVLAVDTATTPDTINAYTDLLLPSPLLTGPANGAFLNFAPTLTWAAYTSLNNTAFTLRLSTDPTFQDPVTTSYTNFAASTFSATTGSFSAIAVPAFIASRTYYWQVRAAVTTGTVQDIQSPWSGIRSYSAAAGTPFLTYPTSVAGLVQTVDSLAPGLTWTGIGEATDYRVQIANDPTVVFAGGPYASPVLTRVVGSATPALQLGGGDLRNNTTYYWQVQAIFGAVNGPYTNAGSQAGASGVFKTPIGIGGTPTLVQPTASNPAANQNTQVALKPLLVWTEVSSAANYEVQLGTDGTFADAPQIILNKTGSNKLGKVLGYQVTETLKPSTNYFWRVRASNATSTGEYSPAAVFATAAVDTPVPAATALSALEITGKLELAVGFNYNTMLYEAYVPGLPGNKLITVAPNSVLFITFKQDVTIVVSGAPFNLKAGKPAPVPVGGLVTISVQ